LTDLGELQVLALPRPNLLEEINRENGNNEQKTKVHEINNMRKKQRKTYITIIGTGKFKFSKLVAD
jgi:hypothetical protein